MKKLIPAIVMLLVSAVVLSTASYAWFTTSTQATASGMSVTAEAPTSILIRKSGVGEFGSSVDLAKYEEQTINGQLKDVAVPVVLKPISSADGANFFLPATCEDYSGAIANGSAITQYTDDGEGYYLEYKVDLKNTGTSAVDLVLEAIQIGNSNGAIMGAVRVAILDENGEPIEGQVGVYTADGITADYVKVPVADDTYEDIALGALGATGTAGSVYTPGVDGAEGTWDHSNNAARGVATTIRSTKKLANQASTPSVIVNIPAHADATDTTAEVTGEVTLTIRIWIEGQDARCFAANSGTQADINLIFNTAANVAAGK